MSEGFATMLPRWDVGGGGENGVPLSRLVAFCCIRGGGEESPQRARRGKGMRALTLALSHDGRGDWSGGGGGGRMDSCLRGNDGWPCEGMKTGWRRERATTRVAPTGGGGGGRMDSCLRVRNARVQALCGNDGWALRRPHKGMDSCPVLAHGNGQPQGLPLREGADGEGGWIGCLRTGNDKGGARE